MEERKAGPWAQVGVLLCSINTWNPSLPNLPPPPPSRVSIPKGAPEGWKVSKSGHENKLWEGMELNITRLVSGRAEDLVPPPPSPPPSLHFPAPLLPSSSRGAELMRSSAQLPALISASRGERRREGRRKGGRGGRGGNGNTIQNLPIVLSQGHFCSQQIKAASQPSC